MTDRAHTEDGEHDDPLRRRRVRAIRRRESFADGRISVRAMKTRRLR